MTDPNPLREDEVEKAFEQIRKYVEYAFDGVVRAPQALDAIDDIARAAITALDQVREGTTNETR